MWLKNILANDVQIFVSDWYGVHHFVDWQDEPLEPAKTYYLIEFEHQHVDVVAFEDLCVYLDLPRNTDENKIVDCLDSYYPDGWEIETATGEESE